jgi:hypothetical protein
MINKDEKINELERRVESLKKAICYIAAMTWEHVGDAPFLKDILDWEGNNETKQG